MKHLIPLLLALLAPMLPIGAQRMVWTSPLQGDIPCIEGRAWNIGTGKNFQRLPARFETTLPANVWELSKQGAGLSVSFVTTARNISVRYGLALHSDGYRNMAPLNHSGLDLYGKTADGKCHWIGNHMRWSWRPDTVCMEWHDLTPPEAGADGTEYILYLPGYNALKFLEIGVDEGAAFRFKAPSEEPPVVVYGSSIIQGASPSRPGLMITNIVARELQCPVVNLGFSGSALMEPAVFDMLAEIEARAFVIDPIPNSYSLDEEEIVKRATEGIRRLRSRSEAPILMVECHPMSDSIFQANLTARYARSNAAFRRAFEQLRAEGVEHLHYLPNTDIHFSEEDMIEGTHPNDLGCRAYAEAYKRSLRHIASLP